MSLDIERRRLRVNWQTVAAVVLVVVVGVVLTLTVPSLRGGKLAQAAPEEATPHLLTVNGEGVVHVRPDIAYVRLGAETNGATAVEAQTANAALVDRVVKKLAELGVKDADMKTTQLSLSAVYAYPENAAPRLTGFRATNQLVVTIRDLEEIGAVIDQCVAAGANEVGNISFDLANMSTAREQALMLAVADAKKRAQVLQRAMDLGNLEPVSVTEASAAPPEVNYMRLAMKEAAAATPVMVGEYELTVQVQVQFAF